jgi:hypothetical protein
LLARALALGLVKIWPEDREDQSDADTQRQKDRLETEAANAHAGWLREQRVTGYMDYLRVVDKQRLWIQVRNDPALLEKTGTQEPPVETFKKHCRLWRSTGLTLCANWPIC